MSRSEPADLLSEFMVSLSVIIMYFRRAKKKYGAGDTEANAEEPHVEVASRDDNMAGSCAGRSNRAARSNLSVSDGVMKCRVGCGACCIAPSISYENYPLHFFS